MIKRYFLLPALMMTLVFVNAQVGLPNFGFENWTGIEPDNWNTNNVAGAVVPVTKSPDAYNGSWSVRGEVELNTIGPGNVSPNLGTYNGQPFPITQEYATLNFYLKLHRVSQHDGITVNLNIFDSVNNPVGVASYKLSVEAANWIPVSVPIIYLPAGLHGSPQDFNMLITLEDTTGAGGTLGSYFLIDNISLGGFVSGIKEATEAGGISVFPNPAVNNQWQVRVDEKWLGSTAELYDVSGKLVYTTTIESSNQTLPADVPQGMYTLKILGKETVVVRLVR